MNWTKSQTEAISYNKNKNILVAAAAGSGKTAVLVERIIQKILDTEKPVSVDEILVLTFTNAAAKEMKNKIAAAIENKLKEFPDNKHLALQTTKIAAADISTIHSFAQKIITNNIHRTNIPVGFTISNGPENDLLINEVISDVLERYYTRMDAVTSFSHLTLGHGGIKNDNNLRQIILEIYNFSRSLAMPEKWLNDSVNKYKAVYKTNSISGTDWEDYFISAVKDIIRQILDCYKEINKIIENEVPDDHKYRSFFLMESQMFKPFMECNTINEFFKLKKTVLFKTKPRRSKDDKADQYLLSILESIDTLRDMAKSLYKKNHLFAYTDEAELARSIGLLYPEIRTLKNIVLTVSRRHTRMKLARSFLDFSDLEHILINLIMNKDGSPTEFCKTLGSKYKEIFVDEYQDTNNIQDTLFGLLAYGRGNIFMVGDIKQSIYKFRNASPDLFLDKYHKYRKDDKSGHLCILSDNFRSRQTVVDTVNFLFRQIMFKEVAEIDYTEDESLHYGASYPNAANEKLYKTELIMTAVTEDTSSDKTVLEAISIAERILKLVYDEKLPVYDSKTDASRPIGFGDIVVLMRATKTDAPIYTEIFREYGIPVLSDNSSGLLESIEIRTVLSFLEIINNPLQDIPLLAVMRSPIFGFTANELSEMRGNLKYGSFYYCVEKSAADGNAKSEKFIKTLTDLRRFSKYMGIHEIIYKICYDLDYMSIASGMRGGQLRKANLNLLLKIASDYEGNEFNGLFNFIDYINKTDSGSIQQVSAESKESVSITTIHKSKGLEYPVVILAGTVKGNGRDGQTLFDENIGIAMDYVDTDSRIRYPSLPMDIIKYKKTKESRAEEMRLLYVALTRAKEKLIISCTDASVSNSKAWLRPVLDSNHKIMNRCIEGTEAFRDWIVYGFLRNENADALREIMETDVSDINIDRNSCDFEFTYINNSVSENKDQKITAECETEASLTELPTEPLFQSQNIQDIQESQNIQEILSYNYPNANLTQIPLKLSVSEIKRSMQETASEQEGEYTPVLSSIADRSFHSAKTDTAAESGTITHFVLQHINPEHTETDEEINEQFSEFVAKNMITNEQLSQVDTDSIYRFFRSDIGKRICRAYSDGRLKREFKMLFPINANTIYKTIQNNCNGEIIVQGIADCIILEDDGIILIDYKTDRCSAEYAKEQAKKYIIQIEYYKNGLEQICGKPVKESIIYFLKPGVGISL